MLVWGFCPAGCGSACRKVEAGLSARLLGRLGNMSGIGGEPEPLGITRRAHHYLCVVHSVLRSACI